MTAVIPDDLGKFEVELVVEEIVALGRRIAEDMNFELNRPIFVSEGLLSGGRAIKPLGDIGDVWDGCREGKEPIQIS